MAAQTATQQSETARKPATHCRHCGLALSREDLRRSALFCCAGCERVYELIHTSGYERYYDLRRGPTAPPPNRRQNTLAWLDGILDAEVDRDRREPRRIVLDIQGIHCAACVWLLQSLFRRMPGMHSLTINPSLGKADIVWTPAKGDLKGFVTEAERFGYRFGPDRKGTETQSRRLALRLGVSVAAALNVMIFSICFYVGLAPADGLLYSFFGQLNFALASLTVVIGGSVFIRSAAVGLRRRIVHLDLPIALGITLAYLGSTVVYFLHGPKAAYFDTVTIFIALMLVGRWLQERLVERNRNALLAAEGIEGLVARRMCDGELESIPATTIERNDELWIVPGDLVPVEGILVGRETEVALDWITGESEPVLLQPGETIPAGAFNSGTRTFRISAQEKLDHSRLYKLLRPVAADRAAGPETRFWHRVASLYVGAVLLFAAGGFLVWAPHSIQKGIEVTIAILVVTCPCALGLATPLARELIHAALRRDGIFLRNGRFLDRALAVRKIIFDKTGTVTLGTLVLAPESRDAMDRLPAEKRSVLGSMAARSNHPASRAIGRAIGACRLVPGDEEITEEPGWGLTWRRTGQVWRLGRSDIGPQEPSGEMGRAVFSCDGETIASFNLVEEILSDAAEEISRLEAGGLTVYLLSGDRASSVRRVAERLGIDPVRTQAGVTPEEKAAFVRDLDRRDTLMIGDGLNDAPSFEAAFCAATPMIDSTALASRADFYFLGAGISAVRRSLLAARRLRRVLYGNLVFAAVYNGLALVFCYAGLVTPVVAAILMPLSSVCVVTLTTFRMRGSA